MTASVLLAAGTSLGDEVHKAGPLWAVVVVLLGIACFFLFRSMSRHLRYVREHAESATDEPRPSADGSPTAREVEPPPL